MRFRPFHPPTDGNQGGDPLPTRILAEPLVGYRTWRIRTSDDGTGLWSIHQPYRWQLENTAECLWHHTGFPRSIPKHPDRPSPDISCACGLYVQLPDHPLTEWDNLVAGRIRATGTAALYGRIIVCDKGYKAQHALLQSPVVIEAECYADLAACPEPVTSVSSSGQDWLGYCAGHASEGMIDVEVWYREAERQLTRRYPGIEFISFLTDF